MNIQRGGFAAPLRTGIGSSQFGRLVEINAALSDYPCYYLDWGEGDCLVIACDYRKLPRTSSSRDRASMPN